jgi:hypothetical protein
MAINIYKSIKGFAQVESPFQHVGNSIPPCGNWTNNLLWLNLGFDTARLQILAKCWRVEDTLGKLLNLHTMKSVSLPYTDDLLLLL